VNTAAPHVLTLSTYDGQSYDGEDFGYWDDHDITCPHHPPTATMACAAWEPCGCDQGTLGELDHHEDLHQGSWPCRTSPTGQHRYVEGEPNRPVGRCWAREWDREISDAAFGMRLPAGKYLIRPWWDGETAQFDLIDPLVVT
jgi:hypothetical protein